MASTNATNPVQPLLPTCADGYSTTTIAAFDATKALQYEPNTWDYYQASGYNANFELTWNKVLPTTVPGIVLGALSAIGFLFFLIWIIVQYCACCCCCGRGSEDPAEQAQFIREEGKYSATKFGLDPHGKNKPSGCTRFLQILILVLTLGTIGVSGYGIYCSLQNTDTQIENFWDLVDTVDYMQGNTTQDLRNLDNYLGTLQYSSATLNQNAAAVSQALTALGAGSGDVSNAINALSGATDDIKQTREDIQSGVATVEQYMGDMFNEMRTEIKPPSLSFQNQGRYVAIVVMFSLTIVSALGAGLLSLRVKHPIWGSVFVCFLWLCVALLMLLGVGLLGGLRVVSKDTCLYAESFAMRYAQTNIQDPQKRNWTVNAMNYYFDQSPVVEEAPGSAVKAVTGVDLTQVYTLVKAPQIQALTTALGNANASQLEALGIPANTIQAVQNVSSIIQPMTDALADLEAQASRSSVVPVYGQTKSLICCDVASASNDLFIAWTVVGSLGLVLALLCSWRIVRHTFKTKKAAY